MWLRIIQTIRTYPLSNSFHNRTRNWSVKSWRTINDTCKEPHISLLSKLMDLLLIWHGFCFSGQNPAEADLNLLETGRRCELYGIKMHSAKDHEGVTLELSVAHIGVVVFQNQAKINTFSWAKIRKLSFKRKKFLIKLHPEGYVSLNWKKSFSCLQINVFNASHFEVFYWAKTTDFPQSHILFICSCFQIRLITFNSSRR